MKRCLAVLSLVTGVAVLAGCGGSDGGTSNNNGGGGGSTTTQVPGSSVAKDVATDVMSASLSGAMQGLAQSAAPHVRTAPVKVSVSIQGDEHSVHAVVTFNDPIVVQSGSAVLTGTLTMDATASAAGFTADVDLDVTATYNNAVLVCDDGNHTVNGQFTISGPMDMTSSGNTVSATWTWTIRSSNLTIDGVAYDINLVYSGTVTYPGALHATLTGTINGVAVNETITATY